MLITSLTDIFRGCGKTSKSPAILAYTTQSLIQKWGVGRGKDPVTQYTLAITCSINHIAYTYMYMYHVLWLSMCQIVSQLKTEGEGWKVERGKGENFDWSNPSQSDVTCTCTCISLPLGAWQWPGVWRARLLLFQFHSHRRLVLRGRGNVPW